MDIGTIIRLIEALERANTKANVATADAHADEAKPPRRRRRPHTTADAHADETGLNTEAMKR